MLIEECNLMTKPAARIHSSPQLTNRRRRMVTGLAALAAVGGAMLFADLGLQAFRALGRAYFVLAAVMAVCLPALPVALFAVGAVGPGWRRVVGTIGLSLVALGAMAWLTAFIVLFQDPSAAFTQHLTPGGSLLMAIGMIVFGSAVLASRRLAGAGRFAPLLVGLYFPTQLIIQLTFFLQGRDGTPGPNGLFLGSWGLIWIWAAWCASRPQWNPPAQTSNAPTPVTWTA
jgi:hypothetical protein